MTRIRIAGGYRRLALAVAAIVTLSLAGCQSQTVERSPAAELSGSPGTSTSAPSTSALPASVSPASTDGPAPGLARFDGGGWHFDYPARWARYAPLDPVAGPSAGFLTDEVLDTDRACDDVDGVQRCEIGPRHGHPGGVLVQIERRVCWGCVVTWDPAEPGYGSIDGAPSKSYRGADGARQWLEWEIADPTAGGGPISVVVSIRQPAPPEIAAEIDRMMGSWRFDPPLAPLDPADRAAFLASAVREAKKSDSTFDCVPDVVGVVRHAKVKGLGDEHLLRPIEVTCSVRIYAVSELYWLVRLEVAWGAQGGTKADADVTKVWLTREGRTAATTAARATPPYCCS